MKIFAVRDEDNTTNKAVAYLFYYEKEKRFYIELPEEADPWETPLILSSFLKKGQKTINAYWSRIWVQQRIVPSDRQNLGMILRDNGLDFYDEYKLLTMTNGRCSQDSYYLEPISEKDLPKEFVKRNQQKVEDVIPLPENQLLVFFRDGCVKKHDLVQLAGTDKRFAPALRNEKTFRAVNVETDGYGICWGENLCIECGKLYAAGKRVPLSMEEFKCFVRERVVDSAEAAEELTCSKQNVDDLAKRGKLHPIKEGAKYRLFLKSEVMQRKWK